MAKKPTYEEPKQRVKELEKEILKLKKAEEERNKFIKAIETIKEAINITTTDTVMIYTNDAMDELFGMLVTIKYEPTVSV